MVKAKHYRARRNISIARSEAAVKRFGLRPLARFVSFAAKGVPPHIMGIGPIEAIPAALRYAAQASLTLASGSRLLIALSGVDAPSSIVAPPDASALRCCVQTQHAVASAAHHAIWIARAIPPRAP